MTHKAPLHHQLHMSLWLQVLKNVWGSKIVRHGIISQMGASTVIFGWKLNCKRQTWISLCLSLSSWQEQSQNFGWSSSWPRCSVQISATRWRWRPLHRLDGYCKKEAQRVLYSKENPCGTIHCETFCFCFSCTFDDGAVQSEEWSRFWVKSQQHLSV